MRAALRYVMRVRVQRQTVHIVKQAWQVPAPAGDCAANPTSLLVQTSLAWVFQPYFCLLLGLVVASSSELCYTGPGINEISLVLKPSNCDLSLQVLKESATNAPCAEKRKAQS